MCLLFCVASAAAGLAFHRYFICGHKCGER